MSNNTLHAGSGRWPLAIVPEWLFDLPDLPGEALRLYCVLERLAQRDGHAHPLRATIATRLGWSVSKVAKMLAALVEARALRIDRQYNASQALIASHYHLAGPEPFPVPAGAPEDRHVSDRTPPGVGSDTTPGVGSDTCIGEGSTSKKITEDSPSESPATPKSAPLVGEIVPAPNPGAAYVDACRLAGYDPLAGDIARIGKAAKQAREQGKPDDLVRRTCETLARRNLGAPLFGRILAELEAGSNGHAPPGRRGMPTYEDSMAILDAFVAAGDEP
jgi:hypothetical protein